MKFGPAEMAQTMDAAKALITVAFVFSVGIGIVLGAIVALCHRHGAADHFRHGAADQSFKSGMPPVPAQAIDATAPYGPRSLVPRANNLLRLVDLLLIVTLIAIVGGVFFSYYTSKRHFEATYNNQRGIQPLPHTIEPQQQVRQAAAPAENINATLCEASSRHAIERTLSSAPTKELVKYVEGLKKGSYAFDWTISGHDFAKQLRFGRRFAATYGQAVEEVQVRLARKGRVNIDEIIEYLS